MNTKSWKKFNHLTVIFKEQKLDFENVYIAEGNNSILVKKDGSVAEYPNSLISGVGPGSVVRPVEINQDLIVNTYRSWVAHNGERLRDDAVFWGRRWNAVINIWAYRLPTFEDIRQAVPKELRIVEYRIFEPERTFETEEYSNVLGEIRIELTDILKYLNVKLEDVPEMHITGAAKMKTGKDMEVLHGWPDAKTKAAMDARQAEFERKLSERGEFHRAYSKLQKDFNAQPAYGINKGKVEQGLSLTAYDDNEQEHEIRSFPRLGETFEELVLRLAKDGIGFHPLDWYFARHPEQDTMARKGQQVFEIAKENKGYGE